MKLLFLTTLATTVTAVVVQKRTDTIPDIGYCGGQPYYYCDYTCFDGVKLCPIKKPDILSYPCGEHCYFESEYICYGDKLCPVPLAPHICEAPDGSWACYSDEKYKCVDGKLELV